MPSAYTPRLRVDNAYLVRERDRRRRRELLFIVLAAIPLGACLLGYIWVHLEVLEAGYHIDRLERSLQELRNQERLLSLELHELSSPELIETRAVEELGMTPPATEQLVFLEASP